MRSITRLASSLLEFDNPASDCKSPSTPSQIREVQPLSGATRQPGGVFCAPPLQLQQLAAAPLWPVEAAEFGAPGKRKGCETPPEVGLELAFQGLVFLSDVKRYCFAPYLYLSDCPMPVVLHL